MIDPAKYPTLASVLITAAPEIKTLKKNKVKLTDEERTAVMKAGAVWHHGPNGEETPAIQKADVKGKTWYWCGTHRAYDCAPTLKGAIKAFEFIKTTAGVLDEVLASHEDLDLSTGQSALKWARKHVDGIEDTMEEGGAYAEQAENRAEAYSNKFHQVSKKNSLTIYRAVCLDSIDQLDGNKIGTHWSFEKEGVGCYGGERKQGNKTFVLTGIVKPKDIDWEYGFTSFMWYGEDQWECALNPGAPVEIIAIDSKKFDKPLRGKACVEARRAPTDQELRDTMNMMRDMGLVPTGKGKPTKPKPHPDFYIVWDSKEKIYYLVTLEGKDKGRWWIIYPEGGNKPLGEFEGQWHKLSGQTVYDEGEWRDYVPLAVIQEVYGLIDPEFNKPRPGEEEFSG